jgi:hypothetical protein
MRFASFLIRLRQRLRRDKLGLFYQDTKTQFSVQKEMADLRVTQINTIEK